MSETKPLASKEATFDQLEIRLGRVTQVELEPTAPKRAYKLTVDFGKFGIKTSVGRFTHHAPEELLGKLVLGVLNFPPRPIGDVVSEVLILGVQYPKADSGEATFIAAAADAKIGSKLF
jgi:tRNA-binding protein